MPHPPREGAVTFRSAGVEDLPALLAFWQASGAHPTHTDDLPSLTRLIETDADALVVAVNGTDLVGSVIAAWDGWRGSIYRLVVAPAYRRHGLGSRLLGHAEQRLTAKGAQRLAAMVVADDDDATGFWRATGWEEQTRRLRFAKG